MTKGVGIALVVILVLVALPIIIGIGQKNRFVTLDEAVNAAWANVDAQLQRRYDLVPNLVNTVKGFAAQEREVLEEITRLRSQWSAAQSTDQKARAASLLEGALGRLMAVVERYPDLKSNQNFLALQDELAGTENRIAVERRRFNEAVQAYNTAIRRFPGSFFAGMFGFEKRAVFEAAEAVRAVPNVSF